MKLSFKISILLIIGFFVVSISLATSSILALKESQNQNVQLFKEEFLALGQDLFENSSKLFFYTFDDKVKTATSSADILNIVQSIEPENNNLIVYSISQKKYLLKPVDEQATLRIDDSMLQKDIQANLLNLQTTFDIDNFQTFANDSTGKIYPSKIELRFYNDFGLIIGYQKPFTIGKIRIEYLQRKNDQLFYSYMTIFISIVIAILIISILLMSFLMHIFIVKPLSFLTQGAKEFGKGKLDTVVNIKGKDEISELSAVFNQMAAQIKSYYAELELKVVQRTKELEDVKKTLENSNSDLKKKAEDLEKINKTMIDRELKMIELKKKITELESQQKTG
jgi:methyl-accepting chemotaxis protein